MLLDKIKVLVRLGILALLVFAVTKVPVINKEITKFTQRIEAIASSNDHKVSALETRIDELERRVDTNDKLSIEQDARLSVLTNRVYELETPKKKPIWRR